MPHARRRGRPATARPGLALDEHDVLSHTLLTMHTQARGVRAMTQQAHGRRHRLTQAAVALVEAVQHVQACLLEDLDATYPPEAAPMTRTRYVSRGGA